MWGGGSYTRGGDSATDNTVLAIPKIQIHHLTHSFQLFCICLIQPPFGPEQIRVLSERFLVSLDTPAHPTYIGSSWNENPFAVELKVMTFRWAELGHQSRHRRLISQSFSDDSLKVD